MRKYFYLVEYSYFHKDFNNESYLDLGVFSSKEKAIRKIERSKNLIGFKDTNGNFEIKKFGVNFDYNIKNKSNIVLYWVFHEYEGEEEFTTIYQAFKCWATREQAEDEIKKLQLKSRLGKKYPNNFEIIEIQVDNFNSWSEGFISLNKNNI